MADIIRRLKRLEDIAPPEKSPLSLLSYDELEAMAKSIMEKTLGRKLTKKEANCCMDYLRNNRNADTSKTGLTLALDYVVRPVLIP